MQATTTNRLSLSYLHRLSRYNYVATASAALISIVSVYWMLFQLRGADATGIFSNITWICAATLSSIWILQAVYLSYRGALQLERYRRIGWLLVGLGQAVATLASTIHILYPHFPETIALVDYPLFFAGLIVLFSTARFRLRTALDAIIITLCLLGVGWFFLLGTTSFVHAEGSIPEPHLLKMVIALTAPIGDVFLLLTLLLLLQQVMEKPLRLSLLLIIVSAILNLWADVAYTYTSVFTMTYQSGSLSIDPFWIISTLLFGLAALYYYNALARRTYNERMHPSRSITPESASVENADLHDGIASSGWRQLQHMFVFIPTVVLLCLVIFGEFSHNDKLIRPTAILAILVGVLVAIRQLYAAREHELLLKEREQRYRNAERFRYIVTTLSEEHDMARLRELVVSMATSELNFTASILLLPEVRSRPDQTSAQAYLFANAASASMHPKQWRLQGDTIFYRTIITTQKTEILWDRHLVGIPEDLIMWGMKQGITSMTFFPLIYQDQVLGSLGIAGAAQSQLNTYQQEIAQTYAEQAAAVIEHALLYQEAREHADFAGALANIATRLNAAAVEPAEISQLICQEGAKALKADYAVLYSIGENDILTPMASYMGELKSLFTFSEWPHFHISIYNKLANYTLLPIIFTITSPEGAVVQNKITRPLFPEDPPDFNVQRSRSLLHKLGKHGVQTAIMAPLTASGKIVGMLILARALFTPGTRNKRSFDSSDLPHAQDFVKQAGVAFNNAQLYQHVQSVNRQLQELDHLKDQFMVTASHELRTPLTAVQGYIELMAQYDEVLPPDQRREFLQKAQRGCEELVILLGNVMDASRLELEAATIATLVQAVSLQETIEDLLILIEPQITQEKREIHAQIPSGLFIYADPIRFRQVLMNISVNALKYSQPGTPIDITAQALIEQGQVLISISDKGKGIAPADHAHLFQRFFRLESDINSPVRGSGLGLYISRRLLEAMNGKIWLESQGIPGEGSTFHIQLPMV